ncbi:MAG TPA: PDZ domain-containing protein, partial [Pyrinomonadaceae bacterium]|nr:PDZ domain-containing protein [Pyrinomonadaceae bacterium]
MLSNTLIIKACRIAFILLVSVLFTPLFAARAQSGGTRLLRSPSVSDTQIAFAYAQNIWVVPRAGGVARRVTSFQGQTANPHFSPDGKWIAFSGEYAGNQDVYVVAAEGGEPKRLTWHPSADLVQGWTPDGRRVMFSSARATAAPTGAPRFWTVSVDGGVEEPMPLPRGFQGKISADGSHIAYRMNNSWDDERRNYRGGQNRPIWIVDMKTWDLVSPPWTDSKDIDPAWLGNTVYFISDRDGVENVWSYDMPSKKLTELTHFRDWDVKTLDAGADVVVFEQAGYIHELDPKSGKEHVVPITVAGDFPWMMPRWEDVSSRITNMELSPTGKRIVVEARGEIFTIPAEKGDVRNLTNSSSAADRDPAWSPDGKSIAYFSDRSGEYKLYIENPDGLTPAKEITIPHPKHYYTVSWSPDSKKILAHDTDLKVWVIDTTNGSIKQVGNDPIMVPARTLNPTWSPDSKWVAYSAHLKSLYRAIFIANAETGEVKQLTDGLSDAVWPVWDANGKYLWFLASTDFGLKSQWLDMTNYPYNPTYGLYMAVLSKKDPSPLLPESDEDTGVPTGPIRGGNRPDGATSDAPAGGPGGAPGQTRARPPVTVTLDWDGLGKRILSVPGVPERQYSNLEGGSDGTVFYLQAGQNQAGPGGGGAELIRYKLSDRKAISYVNGVAGGQGITPYSVSADGKKLVYRAVGGGGGFGGGGGGGNPPAPQLYIIDADSRTVPQAGTGRVNYSLRMYLDPTEEYKQIFNEMWRNERDYLYVPNLHGTDWNKDKEMYSQLLPYVRHRADLNYIMDMMGAEIAIGHSYVRGGDMPDVPNSNAGLLGADFSIENGRYRITRIYDNENWNPDLRSPMAVPGVNVNVGDYLVAINGVELKGTDNIYRLLDGTANRQIQITVNDKASMDGARSYTVVPVPNEAALRTRAWVEENRRLVDKLSGGQLAYVYLPNTGQPGYTSFNRYYFSQQDKKGAVIDERFNGGGSAADYIIDVLQRDFDGYFNNVAGDRMPFTSPAAGIWGPKVMIINEMAGSGGDLMPWMF